VKKVLVLTSTYPKSYEDKVPSFVHDQVMSLNKISKKLKFIVLVPHYFDQVNVNITTHEQYRYHYFWPNKFEKLVGRGILPALKKNKLLALLIPFFLISQIIVTLRYCIKHKPVLIYAHWFFPQAFTALVVKKILNIPYVFTTHAYDSLILNKIPLIGRAISRLIIKNAERYTSVSKSTDEKLDQAYKGENPFKSKSKVIPMPVNITSQHIINPHIHDLVDSLKAYKHRFLFIGRFAEKKGVHLLINIFEKLSKNNKSIVLLIAGDGPEKDKYSKLIQEKSLADKIIVTDFVNSSEKEKLFQNTDYFIIPSTKTKSGDSEGLPVTLLESLYFGKVTIASYDSNAGEIVQNFQNGVLFDPANQENSIKILEKVMNLSTKKKGEIQLNAKKLGENFTMTKNTKIYYSHLFQDTT
jgi:glycosyltransferase involved in cell wall biosynthesis